MGFDELDAYFAEVGGRRLAAGEWGLSLDLRQGTVEVGVRAARGLLRAQAWAAPAGSWEPSALLHRNRALELVRYACTKAGDVWVVGELPLGPGAPVDRLLGALVEAEKKKLPPPYPTAAELRAETEEDPPALIFTIMDSENVVVRRLTTPAKAGISRINWDLRKARRNDATSSGPFASASGKR